LQYLAGPSLDGGRIGYINDGEVVRSRELAAQFLDMLGISPTPDHGMPGGRELRDERPPQPACSPGDDNRLTHAQNSHQTGIILPIELVFAKKIPLLGDRLRL
jgi:hypothetical protein